MILKRLKLQNFLAHKNTDIQFAERGITVFIGENGAGKSSIIEGIVFCLFGKTERGNLSDLIYWGRNKLTVELEFKKGNNLYKIERTVEIKGKRTTSTGTVYKYEKGRYIPYYQKNISKEIPKLTGISQKTFNSSVLVKQGEIEGLLNLSPRERAKVFEDILDMTIYQLLSETAAHKRRIISSQAEALRKSAADVNQLSEEINKINQFITEKENEKKQLEIKLKNLETDYKNKRETLEKLIKEKEKNIKNLSKLEKAKELLTISENQKKKLEKKLKEIENMEKKLPELTSQVEILKELEKNLESIGKLEVIKEKINSITEKIKEYREKEKTVKNLENLANQWTEAEKRISELKETLRKIEKTKGEIDTLNKQNSNISKKVEKILKNISNVLSELIQFRRSYFILKDNPITIEQFIKNNEEKISSLQKEKDQIKEKKGLLKAYGEELKNKINNIQTIEGQCPTCSRPLDQHTKEEILKDLKTELEKRRKEYKELNSKEKDILQSLEEEIKIQKLLKEFKELFDRYTELQKEQREIDSKLTVLKQKVKEFDKLQSEEKDLENFIKKNKEDYQTFIEAKKFLQSTNIKEVENTLSSLKRQKEQIENQLKEKNKTQLKEKIQQLKKYEEEYQKTLQVISQKKEVISELNRTKTEINRLNTIISETSREVIDEKILEEELSSTKKEVEKLEGEIKTFSEEINKTKTEIGKLEGMKESLQKEIQRSEEKLKEAENLEEKAKKYEKIEQALGPKGIQKVIRENAMYELPKITNTIFSHFGFPFQQVRFSEDFDIQLLVPSIEKNDRYISVNSISGGQMVALGLALRLAIGRFLSSKASFLILDEPTIHLDQTRRNELVNILISLKEKQLANQLIIVTHDTEIEDAADSIYYVEGGSIKSIT